MAHSIFNEAYYKTFHEKLREVLRGPNIRSQTLDQLEPRARATGKKTIYGSYGWYSVQSSRIAPKTVYLGSERIRLPRMTDVQKKIVVGAPEEMEKVLHLLRTLPFIHLRRQMGQNDTFNPVVNLYMSVADQKNYRIAYMWGNTMFPPTGRPGPEFTMIHIPEEHQLHQQVLVLPEYNLNICVGSDYMGEDKKGFLRQAMWAADEQGMIGLHAGTKIVTARDRRDGKLKRYGVFLFGMTATGKSTWSCHQLGLDEGDGERTEVAQDDIVFLREDGSAFGSENNFYVKTDVMPDQQEAMYNALVDKTALYENVMIDAKGVPQFLDESLCGNGRAIVFRSKLRIKRGNRLVGIAAPTINIPPLGEIDGLIFAFITRRNTIMPFAQELTPEEGILAYLWGETTLSYASDPDRAGESVRVVGTDPFIVGSRAQKVNRFHDLIMNLVHRYPGKVRFLQYNTGGMGEIIEEYEENGRRKKRMVRKTERVPLNLMAAIQRGDLRGTNRYEKGILGAKSIASVEGASLDEWDVHKMYSREQIDYYLHDLVEGRRKFTEMISNEGLKPEIVVAAERSFSIDPLRKDRGRIAVPADFPGRTKEQPVVIVKEQPSPARPRRPGSWRWR